MREIKFRAWDTDNKVMSEVFKLIHEQDLFDDQHEVMQYTGLKDKNGVEIYEGDIVNYDGHHFVIEYNYEAFKIKNYKGVYYGLPLDYGNFEVIGNIYQDSHLLDK